MSIQLIVNLPGLTPEPGLLWNAHLSLVQLILEMSNKFTNGTHVFRRIRLKTSRGTFEKNSFPGCSVFFYFLESALPVASREWGVIPGEVVGLYSDDVWVQEVGSKEAGRTDSGTTSQQVCWLRLFSWPWAPAEAPLFSCPNLFF